MRKVFLISKKRLLDLRGYQYSLAQKLLLEINKTHRNSKSSLLKQNSNEEKEMLPFVTQYQPLASTVYKKKKLNPHTKPSTTLPKFKEPPITSYGKGKSWQRATPRTEVSLLHGFYCSRSRSRGLSVKSREPLRKR